MLDSSAIDSSTSSQDSTSLLRHRHSGCNGESSTTSAKNGKRRKRRNRSKVILPRMVDRNLPFHQSRNKTNVKILDPHRLLWKIRVEDWFHTLLRVSACLSVSVLLSLWIAMVGTFGVIYWFEDNVGYIKQDCGLGPNENKAISLAGAFAFSLETCTTVGYGLPGASTSFFEKGCSAIQGTIFAEMVCSMMFNAFLFAFFFSLLSKSEFRGSQIIFTDKLLINVDTKQIGSSNHHDNGHNKKKTKAYVRLQCYDIDSAHPLVEAHARMYFLDHRLKMHPLRLMDPNDDLGGVIFPSVPADIVHHIDHHSALCPPKFRSQNNCPLVQSSHGMVLRSLDSYTGNRDEVICPVCGESYGTYERWKKHFDYASMVEARENYPPEKSHCGYVVPPEPEPITLEELRHYIANTVSEIIVVVEAIDPQLSGSFQSLQSYKYEDIVFGEEFENCMSMQRDEQHHKNTKGSNEGVFCVDMTHFHSTTIRHCKHKRASTQMKQESSSKKLATLQELSSFHFDDDDSLHDSETEDEDEEEEELENLRSYRTFGFSNRPAVPSTRESEVIMQDRMPFFATIV